MAISDNIKGTFLVIVAGTCWGAMGVAAQYLLQFCQFRPEDLVSIRLIAAGLVMIVVDALLERKNPLTPLMSWVNLREVSIYGLGVLMAQYTFFLAIRASNAGTAAILVMTVPLFIIAYLALAHHRRPLPIEWVCLVLAFSGVILMVTKGDLSSISLSFWGVFWGLFSAACGAFYTLQPKKILARLGTAPVVGWGMVIGGSVISVFYPPWQMEVIWNEASLFSFAFIVLFGTVTSFWCYMASTKLISASSVGLLVSFEPLSAMIFSVMLLGVTFGLAELVGAALVLLTVVLLSLAGRRK